MLDVAHALILEDADGEARANADAIIEKAGHEVHASINETYKRETWGRRPEDFEAQQAVVGDLARQ